MAKEETHVRFSQRPAVEKKEIYRAIALGYGVKNTRELSEELSITKNQVNAIVQNLKRNGVKVHEYNQKNIFSEFVQEFLEEHPDLRGEEMESVKAPAGPFRIKLRGNGLPYSKKG